MEELRRAFISIDLNGDGRIERKEFKAALDKSGHSYSEVEVSQLMNTLDTNKNGYIDYTEFLAGCMKSKIYLKDEHLRRAFEYFDKVSFSENVKYHLQDHSGTISMDELRSVL